MLYCITLTPETVANFCHESALLSALRHPNIVHVEGVCVVPPCVSIVMELCRGSLFERLRIPHAPADPSPAADLSSAVTAAPTAAVPWDVRLSWALDCCEAVASLHAQRPPLLHLDLKSSNFLVGESRVARWTARDVALYLATAGLAPVWAPVFATHRVTGADLAFLTPAALATLVGPRLAAHAEFPRVQAAVAAAAAADARHARHGAIKVTDLELTQSKQALMGGARLAGGRGGGGCCGRRSRPAVTPSPSLGGGPDGSATDDNDDDDEPVPSTPNWTAPEVFVHGRRAYSPATDVYALAMVLWEILTARVPFDEPGAKSPGLNDEEVGGRAFFHVRLT